MPELPEVETLRRQLESLIFGKEILDLLILDPKLGPLGSMEGIAGRKVSSVKRIGKTLSLEIEDNMSLRLHLRMTGRLFWQKGIKGNLPPPHARFRIFIAGGRLDCIDPRRFATLLLVKDIEHTPPAPDPLEDFDIRRLWKIAQKRKIPVKSFLMDQSFISGIGNIYASEILHNAKVDPWRQVSSLAMPEWRRIAEASASILHKAIKCRGTSISDWRDLFGKPGEYQNYLKVYGREGLACHRCGEVIQRISLGGRGTYFCPSCQK